LPARAAVVAGVIGAIARTGVTAEATVGAVVDLAVVVGEISITVAVRVVAPAAAVVPVVAVVPQGSVAKEEIVLRVAVVDFPAPSLRARGIVRSEIVVPVQLDLRVLPEIARIVVMVAAIAAHVVMVAAQIVVIVVTIVRKKSVHAWPMAGGPASSLSPVPSRPWPNKSKPPVAPILSSMWRSCSFPPVIGIWCISSIKIPLPPLGRIQPKSLLPLRFLLPRLN
jgi:hypothetical protein